MRHYMHSPNFTMCIVELTSHVESVVHGGLRAHASVRDKCSTPQSCHTALLDDDAPTAEFSRPQPHRDIAFGSVIARFHG